MNFLTYPHERRSTLRSKDVLVYRCVGGKHAYVNLIRASTLVGLRIWSFTLEQIAFKVASSKVFTHEKIYVDI